MSTVRGVELQGELDLATLPAAMRVLAELDGADIAVIDMRSVTYMDSATVGTLMEARVRIERSGGVMRIVSADPRLRRLLSVTGIAKSVAVFDDIDAAFTAPRG